MVRQAVVKPTTQTVNAITGLRRDLLPAQPKKFAILAEGPLEEIRRLQIEIDQLTAELAAA